VASYWQDGKMFPLLKLWSQSSPLAILQMLPEWLWLKTGLGLGAKVTLVSDEPGLTNSRLKIRDVLLWENVFREQNRLQIPVFTLEPLSVARWSGVVVGRGDTKVAGFVLTPDTKEELEPEAELNLTPEEIVRRFRNNASLLAQELAELLAAAPTIFLPVVRLIRKEMLPSAGQVQIAEVFLGGILRVRSLGIKESDPDAVLYDFINPEVRKILQCSSTRSTTVDVFDRVSKYIAKQLNLELRDFLAELKKPPTEVGTDIQDIIRPFAEVAASILRNLGGNYLAIAQQLEQGQPKATQTAREEDFLTRFTPETTTIEVGRLTILEGEAETEFIALREQCASLNLEDGDLYELAIESGIKELEAQILFIYNKRAEQTDLPPWDGETVFVDRQGNIIKRQPVTAKYYEEDIPFNKRKDQPPAGLTEIRMLLIPGGTLLKDGKTIYIKPFFMAQTPITQAQWWAIASRKDLKIKNNLDLTPSRFKDDYGETSHWLRPVEKVSWFDAIEYCGRLAKLTKFPYALPSEAQWEYACHANTEAPLVKGGQGGSYPPFHYGETLTAKLANYDSQQTYADEAKTASPKQTTPVGNYPPNAFGLQDMHGNVWEWCIDLWDAEERAISGSDRFALDNNPTNLLDKNITMQLLSDKNTRVLRGGSWNLNPWNCRSARRSRLFPGNRLNYVIGFRVVCRFPRT
jgi:formylglycine-generating enzyme required for sulfatase activity